MIYLSHNVVFGNHITVTPGFKIDSGKSLVVYIFSNIM